MGLFDHFPYTNVHELNLDWVLSMMKALEAEWEAFTAGNSLSFADPMLHDVTKTYAKNTIVLDSNGNAYVSLQAVPVGVGLQNGDYWLMVFDYEAFIEKVNKNFTARYYRGSYRATAAMAIGDWLTVDDVLCKVIAAIAADDVLELGVNIEHFTLEDFIKAFMQSANQLIQQYKNDIDASELLYRQQLAQDIANTTNSLQAQLDAAISGATVDSEVINARVGANGYTYSTLGDALRKQITQNEKLMIITAGSFNFNTGDDQLEYTSGTTNLNFGGNCLTGATFAAAFAAQFPISLSGYNFGYIYMDDTDGTISLSNAAQVLGKALIGVFYKAVKYYQFALPFTVDGSVVSGYNTKDTHYGESIIGDLENYVSLIGDSDEVNILQGVSTISGYLNTSNGESVISNAGFKTTKSLVPVEGGATYSRNWNGGNIYEYDKNGVYIRVHPDSGSGTTYTLTANTAFARFTMQASVNPILVKSATPKTEHEDNIYNKLSRRRNLNCILNAAFNFNTTLDQLEYNGATVNLNFSGDCLQGGVFVPAFLAQFPVDLSSEPFGFIYINYSTYLITIDRSAHYNSDDEVLIGAFYKAQNYYNLAYPYTVNGQIRVAFNTYADPTALTHLHPYKNTILSALGDSISEPLYAYWRNFGTLCGFTTLDVDAVGGSCIADGDQYESHTPMVQRYSALNASAEVIYVFGGTNDWGHDIPIGTMGDTVETTFYGALDTLCVGLLTRYPLKKVFFITPLQRNDDLWPANGQPSGSHVNGQGKKLIDYVNAIKEVCSKYSIPVLDLYNNSCITGNINAIASTLYNDGLHPTSAAHTVIGKEVANFINNII